MNQALVGLLAIYGRVGVSDIKPDITLASLGLKPGAGDLSELLIKELLSDIEIFGNVKIELSAYLSFDTVADLNAHYEKLLSTP